MRLLALALLVLLAPVASACSFVGELPPGPGAFVLTDLADGTEWRVRVEERGLGGTCELSNPVALADGWIAWLEGGRLYAQDVHASAPSVDLPFEGLPRQLSLFDDTLVALDRDRMRLVDLDTGAERTVPLPAEGSRALEGRLVAFQDGFGSGATLSVYDARDEAWLVHDRDVALGERWWPWLVDDGWLVLHSEPHGARGRYHLLDLVSGELRDLELPPSTSLVDLDGGWLYLRVSQRDGAWLDPHVLARMPVAGGAVEDVAELTTHVASVAGGLALTPAFSEADHRPLRVLTERAPTPPTPPTPSPSAPLDPPGPSEPTRALPFPLVLPLVLAVAIARRRQPSG